MKIYGHSTIGNPRRVAIFLKEKGAHVPFEEVDFISRAHKREPFLSKNPFGRVPVLELDDGSYLTETVAICRYFEALFPYPPMFGVGHMEQAIVEMWQRRAELEIFIQTSQYVRHTSPELKRVEPVQFPEWGEVCRERAEAGLRIVDRQLADTPFLAGACFTIADITLAHQLLGMPGATGIPVPNDCRHLARWLESVLHRPSIAETQPTDYGLVQPLLARREC